MSEEVAHNVGPARIDIGYGRCGDPAAPPVLLIMGGGAQMINWPEVFCAELVDRGRQVIRFHSRDTAAWLLASSALVLLMTPGLAEEGVPVLGADGPRPLRCVFLRRSDAGQEHAQHDDDVVRHDQHRQHPVRVRGVPVDVRDHHSGADLRL